MLRYVTSWCRQFSLRTLLLLLAIASGCLAFEVKFVRDRRAALADRRTVFGHPDSAPIESVPWIIRMRGEYTCGEVVLLDYDPKKLTELQSLFPEATVRHACTAIFDYECQQPLGTAYTP